jgi:hypothetical protein
MSSEQVEKVVRRQTEMAASAAAQQAKAAALAANAALSNYED